MSRADGSGTGEVGERGWERAQGRVCKAQSGKGLGGEIGKEQRIGMMGREWLGGLGRCLRCLAGKKGGVRRQGRGKAGTRTGWTEGWSYGAR